MSKPKHTPGPWTIDSDFEDSCFVGQPNGAPVASLCCGDGQDMQANARLIAAAPELLRELKAAIFYIETFGGETSACFAAGGNMQLVKTLIARAEGRDE